MDPRPTPRFAAYWTSTHGAVRLFLGTGSTPARVRAKARRALARTGFAAGRETFLRLTRVLDRPGWEPPPAA